MSTLSMIVAAGCVGAGAGAAAWGAVAPSSQLYGPTIWRTGSGRQIGLTFDDGPNPSVTPRLLELLERHSARATFFVVGKFVRACPDLVREISARGHALGNHTDTHPNLFFHLPSGIRDEIARCQEAIAGAVRGHAPRWMRPPFGYRNPWLDGEACRAGMQVVTWSKLCRDWKPQPPQRLIEKLANVSRTDGPQGDLVLLHDGDHRALGADRAHVLAALEHWLPRWRDTGVEFVTMNSKQAFLADAAPAGRGPRDAG